MTWLATAARRFLRDEDGVSLVEYALLVALIVIVGIVAITALGTAISGFWSSAASSI